MKFMQLQIEIEDPIIINSIFRHLKKNYSFNIIFTLAIFKLEKQFAHNFSIN